MLMCSMLTMVAAQDPIQDISVISGQVGTSDFTATTTAPSTTLGGLISEIVETHHATVKLAGVTVSDKMNTTRINNFSLYLFGDISKVNLNDLQTGAIYQQSENIAVRNVTGQWTTYLCNSTTTIPARDVAAGLNENFTANDGTFVKATAQDLAGTGHTITFTTGTITLTQFEAATLCGGLTNAQAGALSGSTSPKDTFCGQLGTVKVIGVGGTSGAIPVRFIYDLNNDGVFNNMQNNVSVANGYKVNAINGQSLALIPSATYDLFAII